MRITIISDIHDNIWSLEAALEMVKDSEVLICCRDLCSPFIVDLMADGFPKELHMVFGNNDGDQYRITNNANKYNGRVKIHGEFAELRLGGKRIGVNHYPQIARAIAESSEYDVVCYGHDHIFKIEKVKNTLLINPGAIMGYDGVHKKDIPSTFVIYDIGTGKWKGYEVKGRDNSSAKKRIVVELSGSTSQ